MRRICLLYNPVAGRNRERRRFVVEQVAAALRRAECEVGVLPTTSAASIGAQANDASRSGAEIVFACGGDGTVHGAVQGLALQANTSLGVVPLGSANALARHLGLPTDPVQAALLQLMWRPRILPLGQVTYRTSMREESRYFLVMAGAGADGALVYRMLSSNKQRFGRLSYYLRAAWLTLCRSFAPFEMSWGTEPSGRLNAMSAVAVRVADLGGAFSPLVRGGSLERGTCRIAVASGNSRVALSAWFALSWLGLARLNRHVRFFEAESFTIGEGENGARVQVQADGEWLGTTPMSVRVVPDALRLLVPDRPV